jgi:ABC-type antimicrobial peptide transport system permease subunit
MGVGLLATIIAGRALRSTLFGVEPVDLATLILTLLIVAAAAMIAVLLPTRRASRVDPVVAIHAQ